MIWFLSFLVTSAALVASAGFIYVTRKTKKNSTLPTVQSKEVPEAEQKPGHGVPRTSVKQIGIPNSTIHHLLKDAVSRFTDRPMFGVRPLIGVIKEEKVINGQKKEWQFSQLGEYQWLSYKQAYQRILNVGSGLRHIGIKPGDFLGIYEDTRIEWSLIAHGSFAHSVRVTTVYANLGPEAVAFAISETNLEYMLTNGSLLANLASATNHCQSLKHVIHTDKADPKGKSALEERGIKVYQFDEIEKWGEEHTHEPEPPKPDNLAVVMYTSGSTGNPKGVMIQHRHLVAAAVATVQGAYFDVGDNDVYISFLPLAHVLALVAENSMINAGIAVGFANPRSLTDASVRKCKGDLTELKPTLMAGVPTIYDRIKKGAREKIEKSGFITNYLFNFAYSVKQKALPNNEDTPVLNELVFNNFRNQLGGRMRVMLSGGAPLSKDTHEFLKICFSCSVIQGYGLTETCGGGTVMHVDDNKLGRVGPPLPCCTIKLVSVPDMNYDANANPPRGEVWISGPNVAEGYYKNPEKTKEEFREGGWFATGDVGEWNQDGCLKIIDRIKNLVKLAHGEYIALENLESKFKNSPYVDNLCVYGDSEESFLVAIVVPAKDALRSWARKNNIPEADDHEKLCQNRKARDEVLNSLVSVGKSAKMKPVEFPKDVYLSHEEWTPENNMMTAAMKLKRGPITEAFKDNIKEMYKNKKE